MTVAYSLGIIILILNAAVPTIAEGQNIISPEQGCQIIPDHKLEIPVDKNRNNELNEASFNEIIDQVVALYEPLVAIHGYNLSVEKNWKSGTVNAYARQVGDKWQISMFGGLARHEAITPDAFALVVCHELGHHLGGYPMKRWSWSSTEGQADYFAGHACAKKIWGEQASKNAAFRKTIAPYPQQLCDQTWDSEADQNLCYRISQAGKSLGNFFSNLRNSNPPSWNTPDMKKVMHTESNHPTPQCRLDTYLAGMLCTEAFMEDKIPGKNHPQGQNSREAEELAAQMSCTAFDGFSVGMRPRCWFAPKLAPKNGYY